MQNLSSTLVNWSVSVSNGGSGNAGTIDSGGNYLAPSTVPSNNVVTVTATSQVQSTVTATQNLTIEAATAIATVTCTDPNTNPPSVTTTVSSGNRLSCTAADANGNAVGVGWTVANANSKLGGNVGMVNSGGSYIAPLVPPPGQMVTITATSLAVSSITSSVTVKVVFGDNVLSGSYVFNTGGRQVLSGSPFWARTGSFSAGNRTLTGIEDTNQGGTTNLVNNSTTNTSPPTPRTFTGSYSIGPDGRGTMQFCEDTSAPCPEGASASVYFRIAVLSPQQIEMIEFSAPPPGSGTTGATSIVAGGEMIAQDPSVFNPSNGILPLSGVYSFSFPGVSSTGTAEALAGEFKASGFTSGGGIGNISAGGAGAPGELDMNVGTSDTVSTINASTYRYSSNGRGTVTLSFGTGQPLTFSFYMASASRAKFIEIDPPPTATTAASILLGDAYQQQITGTCQWSVNNLSGLTILEVSGLEAGPISAGEVGSFTPSNNGTTGSVGGGTIDENDGGTLPPAQTGLSGSYTVDPCGRGQLSVGTHAYVYYPIAPSNAVLLETTAASQIVATGLLLPSQSGSFADGSYAFRLEGADAAGSAGHDEDFLGQLTSATASGSPTATWNGTLDDNDFGSTQITVPVANGAYSPASSAAARTTATVPLGNPVSATRNLVLYMVSSNLFYALDVDTTGTAIGLIGNQF